MGFDKFVGARIRARRVDLGVTQQGLARAIGVTFQQLQKYETGANRISASRLFAVAVALKAPLARFFDDLPFHAAIPIAAQEPATEAFLSDPDRHELARAMQALSQAQRRAIVGLVR